MSGRVNHRILLASRPVGEPTLDDFSLVGEAVPTPGPGQLLLRAIHLSLDPYMRGRMNAAKSYAAPVEVGEVLVGGTVSEIVASNAAVSDFADQHQQFVAEVGAWCAPEPSAIARTSSMALRARCVRSSECCAAKTSAKSSSA